MGILAGILCGGAIGLVNGLMVTQVHLPPLLATLGMMVALRGGAFLITGGHTIYGVPTGVPLAGPRILSVSSRFDVIDHARHFPGLLLRPAARPRFGLYMYAIGGDRIASRRAGINDRLFTWSSPS